MTQHEYATVLVAVGRALMDLRERFPWCEIRITGKTVHLTDRRVVKQRRARRKRASHEGPDQFSDVVAGLSPEKSDG